MDDEGATASAARPIASPPGFLRALDELSPSLSVRLIRAPVHNAGDIDAAITGLAREQDTGLMIMPDIFNDANHEQIAGLLPNIACQQFTRIASTTA